MVLEEDDWMGSALGFDQDHGHSSAGMPAEPDLRAVRALDFHGASFPGREALKHGVPMRPRGGTFRGSRVFRLSRKNVPEAGEQDGQHDDRQDEGAVGAHPGGHAEAAAFVGFGNEPVPAPA